jgi:hypothetical protein
VQVNWQSDIFISPVYSVPEIQALIDFVGISGFVKRYSNSFDMEINQRRMICSFVW